MIYNMKGDANRAGPVRLSDVYSSSVGSAKDGIAASQKALYDAYNSLNSRLSNQICFLVSFGAISGATINSTTPVELKTKTINISKGTYIWFYGIQASWTSGSYQFQSRLIAENETASSGTSYSYPPPSSSKAGTWFFCGGITFSNTGLHTLAITAYSSGTGKEITIATTQVLSAVLVRTSL